MPLNTGTMSLADLQGITATVTDFGPDRVADVLARDLANYNLMIGQAVAGVAEVSSQNLRRAGVSTAGRMILANDYSRAPTQRPGVGGTLGFPKDLFQIAVGWTQRYLNKATVAEVATTQLNIRKGHALTVMGMMKTALYAASNVSATDYTERNAIAIPVKRFYNADSWGIPDGPNGEVFTGSSHTHYLANATLTAAFVTTLVNTVAEHNTNSRIVVAINAADEAAFRALTGFTAYVDTRLQLGTGQVPTEVLSNENPGNRPIGLFGLAQVWVKPWAIANYAVAYDMNAPEKPLVLRTPNGTSPSLALVATNNAFPLIAEFYESEFGFGAFGRGAGAVLYFAGGSYVEPTITI